MDTGSGADEVTDLYSGASGIIKDPFAKNTQIQDIANDTVNFDETNPFGNL